ncbi:hypothetical protein CCB80_05510 [Armatimonadetes bacterium Uphvl-Ar1]|nr:hypothetical protein CCB80_05510 [Armatimonadetes bacterium Uphvl-Ar1]
MASVLAFWAILSTLCRNPIAACDRWIAPIEGYTVAASRMIRKITVLTSTIVNPRRRIMGVETIRRIR